MNSSSKKTDLTIIGGGFAGLAAALRLHHAGVKIQIIEKRPFFGGRAYSFREPKTGATVDNGQHLLMGAYHETFAFLRSLGTLGKLDFQDKLQVSYAFKKEGVKKLSCPQLPAPLHLGFGLLGFEGLKFKDKWGMGRLIRFCQQQSQNHNGHGGDDRPVAPTESLDELTLTQLLQETRQTPESIRVFWEPLVLATLNEPLSQASSEMFFNVLRLGFLSKRKDSRLVFPKVGFSELYGKPAAELLQKADVPIHFQTQIESLEKVSAGERSHWNIRTSGGKQLKSERILLAVPPDALTKILKNSPSLIPEIQDGLSQFQPAPIVSINLWYKDFSPRESFVGLLDSPLHWMFHKAKIFKNEGTPGAENYLSVVVSGAYDLAGQDKAHLVDLTKRELEHFYPELKGKELLHSQVIKEHGATFSGRVGLKKYRPQSKTKVPGLYLAGDWTATDLPATIESAVKSGHQAAEAIIFDSRV